MVELKNYLQDGANWQARGVLTYLQGNIYIANSWNEDTQEYDAKVKIGRWENCREQGYVVSLRNKNAKQLNIAFFEHRNSDRICAVKWLQNSTNTLTIDTAKFGDIYKNKYDVSFQVSCCQFEEMGTWIIKQLQDHWNEGIESE